MNEQAILEGAWNAPRATRRDSLDSSPSDAAYDDDKPSNSITRRTAPGVAAPAPTVAPTRGPKTGPKGVLNDHNANQAAARAAGRARVAETRAAQERAAITAPTVHEEAARREEEKRAAERDHDELRAIIDARRRDRGAELGLREVGRPGFINAVERGGWVCVFIYEEDSRCYDRCLPIMRQALDLARSGVMIVRARANVLGFGVPGKQFGIIAEDDDDDDDEGIAAVGQADPDILPTILAYYNGELEKTWVRVDFELRDDGLAGLLYRENIITHETLALVM